MKLFLIFLFSLLLVNCKIQNQNKNDVRFVSFRDVPGITEEEINAIESFRERGVSFVHGTLQSTESFYNSSGELRGFTVLLCEWLSELFGIRFEPKIFEWDELLSGLESGEIDFTSELTATEKRRETYFMTDAIANRFVSTFRLIGSENFSVISKSRPLRYGFLADTTTFDEVLELSDSEFIPYLVDNYEEAYALLINGEIDAFLEEHTAEAAFEEYGNIIVEDFFPLIFGPVSLSTQKPENLPIISVVQKILDCGGIRFLVDMYNLGEQEYIRHKLMILLTEEEHRYIQNNPVVKFVAEHDNYPLSFFNNYDNEFQGICFDVMKEIENLTGLRFERLNNQYDDWGVILQMLEDGEAYMISELIRTPEREGRFLWPSVAVATDFYALITKDEFRSIKTNEIMFTRVGLVDGYAQMEVFNRWFPDHAYTVTYENSNQAFEALERGEIEAVMASQNQLLVMTNFLELPGYKANIIFNYPYQSTFGFNIEKEVLCSIAEKALFLIDTAGIEKRWTSKTYDYRVKIAQAQFPYLIGAIILLFFILVLVIFLYNRNKMVIKIKEESRSKSIFLANMSHEIRTPMNAILGMAELVLRCGDLSAEARRYTQDIKHAGETLISIINDILDFSKIEAGKLELVPVNYYLSSLLNDTVNIIRTRLLEKPLQFKVDIDKDIPNGLTGDEVRIRQILLNLLSNAVKYTEKGSVELTISEDSGRQAVSGAVWLKIAVSDTGKGIKPEDLKKLFINFTQVDTKKNLGIEGTGLGLAITKQLCEAMGGSISVVSEYGFGSTFTVIIPQAVHSTQPFGSQEILYNNYFDNTTEIKYIIPSAKILLVDDLPTNLIVAQGLLAPYKAKVDTCSSGEKAIELVKQNEYDIIFMDHMMPEMDGIEAVSHIRTFNKQVPIIALTANAVTGMKEMFIDNGFNDFLAKPINISKLDEILYRWIENKFVKIENEKQSMPAAAHSLPPVKDIDIDKGIAMTGGTEKLYRQVLALYYKDGQERLPLFQTEPQTETLKQLAVNFHAIKSASASIGAEKISAAASELEMACNSGSLPIISEMLKSFTLHFEEMLENIRTSLDMLDKKEMQSSSADNPSSQFLYKLSEALKSQNIIEINNIIEKFKTENPDSSKSKIIENISMYLLLSDFDSALKEIEEALGI